MTLHQQSPLKGSVLDSNDGAASASCYECDFEEVNFLSLRFFIFKSGLVIIIGDFLIFESRNCGSPKENLE